MIKVFATLHHLLSTCKKRKKSVERKEFGVIKLVDLTQIFALRKKREGERKRERDKERERERER